MKKQVDRKLGIRRDTVRTLTPIAPADLGQVAGGVTIPQVNTRTKTTAK